MITPFRRYSRPVNLLLTSSFVLTLARAISLPFLVVYLSSSFGLGIAAIGAMVGGALVGGSLLSLYGGYLTDRCSNYSLILSYAACFILGFVGMLLTSDVRWFFVFLVAFNFAYSVMDVVVKASFGRLLPAAEQPKVFSVRYTLINMGYAIGPFLGAWLAQAHLKLPFAVSALLGLGFLLVYARWGERHPGAAADLASPSFLAVGRVLLADRRLVCFTLGGLLSAVVFGQFTAYLSQYLVSTGSATAAYPVISTLVAVNAVVVVTLQYGVGRRIDPQRLQAWLTAGLALFLIGILGFALAEQVWQWGLAMAVFTLGEIIVFPAEYMFIDRIAPPHLRGMYYGAQNLANLGAALGPVLCGWVLAVLAPGWMFVMLAGFIVAGGLAYSVGARLAASPA
ncbi:MFS transporter [Pseudomonas sp. DC3000-4b1]|uniref:MFS transporter n=1 Tax=unclassified Pseudomonas TaxID=196821 RepID=UPI003CE7A577